MPTLMLISAEGEEIGRFGGFKPPEEFMQALKECRNSLDNIKTGGELLDKNKEDAKGLYLRALGNLYQREKISELFKDLDKLTALKPDETNKAFICKGLRMLSENISKRPGRVKPETAEAAEKEFEAPLLKIVEIDPGNESGETVHALYRLGVASVRDQEKKKGYFDKLKKLDPQDKYGYADNMAFVEALAPFYKRDYRKTAENLQVFVENNKSSELVPKALFQLANCWYRLGEKSKCAEVLEKLIEGYPDSNLVDSAKKVLERVKK
jgi:TolA-binding protein